MDISVTGAAIEAPYAEDLYQGHRVRIGLDDLRGTVAIRRALPSSVPEMARYGVEFVELDPGLADLLRAMLEADRPDGLEAHWERAR